MLITSALEFLLGWISEKLLHQRLWDYSDMPFNLCGHICLAFSLVWGFACLLVVRVFHPVLMGLVALIPHTLGWILLALFSATFLTDLVLTLIAALKLPKQVRAVEDMEKLLRSISDGIGEGLYSGVTKLELENKKEEFQARMEERNAKNAAKRQELEEKITAYRRMVGKNRTYRRWVKAFPHLQKERHHRRLESSALISPGVTPNRMKRGNEMSRLKKGASEFAARRSKAVLILYFALRLIVAVC